MLALSLVGALYGGAKAYFILSGGLLEPRLLRMCATGTTMQARTGLATIVNKEVPGQLLRTMADNLTANT